MVPRIALRQLAPLLQSPSAEGRLALIQNLDQIAELALNNEATLVSQGCEVVVPKPDYTTALRCQEYGAKMLGIGPLRRVSAQKRSAAELVELIEQHLISLLETGGSESISAARLVLEQRGLLVHKQLTASTDLSNAEKEELAARLERALALGVE